MSSYKTYKVGQPFEVHRLKPMDDEAPVIKGVIKAIIQTCDVYAVVDVGVGQDPEVIKIGG